MARYLIEVKVTAIDELPNIRTRGVFHRVFNVGINSFVNFVEAIIGLSRTDVSSKPVTMNEVLGKV